MTEKRPETGKTSGTQNTIGEILNGISPKKQSSFLNSQLLRKKTVIAPDSIDELNARVQEKLNQINQVQSNKIDEEDDLGQLIGRKPNYEREWRDYLDSRRSLSVKKTINDVHSYIIKADEKAVYTKDFQNKVIQFKNLDNNTGNLAENRSQPYLNSLKLKEGLRDKLDIYTQIHLDQIQQINQQKSRLQVLFGTQPKQQN